MAFMRNLVNRIKFSMVWLFLPALFTSCASAQLSYTINDQKFIQKSIVFEGTDTINYLINATGFNFDKPTAVYFNGSYPTPLIFELQDSSLFMVPFAYFDLNKFINTFNLVIVSKPFTPVFANIAQLNASGAFVPDINHPDEWDSNFVKCNSNLDYMGRRGAFLVDWLLESKLINSNRIVSIGHSQGGREAARAAKLNASITDVVMLSASPYGRIQHVLSQHYLQFLEGKIDFQTYTAYQKEFYEEAVIAKTKQINSEPLNSMEENLLTYGAHAFVDVIQTKANVLFVSGTKDMASFYADQLMIDALLHGKFNIKIKQYEDYEHSFLKVESTGDINYEDDKWQEVFNEIILWFENN